MNILNIINEAIYGKAAVFYHRTRSEEGSKAIVKKGFDIGLGAYYGPGIYGCYELEEQFKESMEQYGDYIVKSKTNIYGFLTIYRLPYIKILLLW